MGDTILNGLRAIGIYLSVSHEKVSQLIEEGLPVYRDGRKYWARVTEIDAWLESNKVSCIKCDKEVPQTYARYYWRAEGYICKDCIRSQHNDKKDTISENKSTCLRCGREFTQKYRFNRLCPFCTRAIKEGFEDPLLLDKDRTCAVCGKKLPRNGKITIYCSECYQKFKQETRIGIGWVGSPLQVKIRRLVKQATEGDENARYILAKYFNCRILSEKEIKDV